MGAHAWVRHPHSPWFWFSTLVLGPLSTATTLSWLGLDGGQYKVVLRDLLSWVVGFHMICVLGFDWHRLFNMELLGILLPATHRAFYMVGGMRWSTVARFSVLDWACSLGLCISFFTRVNFLILAFLSPVGN
ncbi:hypothetical protein RchiOBHm_Chr2g0121481 [Rosa chinensis]|uniref:Uncharacterized protein n=1 Tax=Rosa chinensis TaxID=74649 RepID=A0A2P6RSJ7_ROSCH|nr:hypothetical protein RchiOBHm_Chr2g0121481 [Rosa chinensis]